MAKMKCVCCSTLTFLWFFGMGMLAGLVWVASSGCQPGVCPEYGVDGESCFCSKNNTLYVNICKEAIPDDGVPLTTLTTTLSTINLSCNDRIKLYYDHSVSWSNTTFDCMNSEEATSQGTAWNETQGPESQNGKCISPQYGYVDIQGILHVFGITWEANHTYTCREVVGNSNIKRTYLVKFSGIGQKVNMSKTPRGEVVHSSMQLNLSVEEGNTVDLECVCVSCSINGTCGHAERTRWEGLLESSLIRFDAEYDRHIRFREVKGGNPTVLCFCGNDAASVFFAFSTELTRVITSHVVADGDGIVSNCTKADFWLIIKKFNYTGTSPFNLSALEDVGMLAVFKNQCILVLCFVKIPMDLQIDTTAYAAEAAMSYTSHMSTEMSIPKSAIKTTTASGTAMKILNCTFNKDENNCIWSSRTSYYYGWKSANCMSNFNTSGTIEDQFMCAQNSLTLHASEPNNTVNSSLMLEFKCLGDKIFNVTVKHKWNGTEKFQTANNSQLCRWETFCFHVPNVTDSLEIHLQTAQSDGIVAIDNITIIPNKNCQSNSQDNPGLNDSNNSNINDGDKDRNSSISIPIIVPLVIAVFMLIAIIFIYHWRHRQHHHCCRQNGESVSMDSRQGLPKDVNVSIVTKQPHYIIFPHAESESSVQLRILEAIGEGNFGRVFRGEAKGIVGKGGWTDVAVKMCKEDATDMQCEDLQKEIKLLSQIPEHTNILPFLGYTTMSGVTLLIVEYVNGPNLLRFLRRHRPDARCVTVYQPLEQRPQMGHANDAIDVTNKCLLSWQELASLALQVAKGMEHLAEFKVIHRDLAARNVLVNELRICKICDFGLARMLPSDNIYEKKSKSVLPIRWMAPESLQQGLYTTKSDVWSYGVLIWEIITLGASPWSKHAAHEVIAKVYNQELLPKPEHCSEEIYKIMQDCWQHISDNRPTFSQIRAIWESMLEKEGDYIQMDHMDYELYSAIEPDSDTSSLSDDENSEVPKAIDIFQRKCEEQETAKDCTHSKHDVSFNLI